MMISSPDDDFYSRVVTNDGMMVSSPESRPMVSIREW